ncbi:MAG TPA: MarR family transcriptional regulator [Tenuifilaceae bacterium]|nr:MarR family transcriptional regulator [Tenuifilaceae bacterium]HPE17410.1 MarR family transcriptional regulator [Tenuifilaceae bacterium]HPJ46137.1 MarR family transcriptional regulator [Tenuifilaceae bacterium]HPQ34538.1 MarR family transcriptional regulator [Tenuifilaceae bacterium]HRX66885.1 MarR family transcriptional regulator [Tenuifilaceae bacterium]
MQIFTHSFVSILTRISTRYRTELNHNFARNGNSDITADYWIVLESLYDEDNLTIGQLAKRTNKDNAGLSRILDGMERNDLVNRIASPTDKRSYLIVLTSYAKSLKEKLSKIEEETLSKSAKGLNPIEVKELVRMMNHLFENLERT